MRPVDGSDGERAVPAAGALLHVKVPKQEAQGVPLWSPDPPSAAGVHRVGAWVVLGGQGATLCAQNRVPTTITCTGGDR